MKKTNQRGRMFYANSLHREVFCLVLLAALVPTISTSIALYYLIFNVTANQIAIPEMVAENIFPAAHRVLNILFVVTPVLMTVICVAAYKISHRILGPFDRIVRELDEHIKGTRQGHIKIRPSDKFLPLVERINLLLDKIYG